MNETRTRFRATGVVLLQSDPYGFVVLVQASEDEEFLKEWGDVKLPIYSVCVDTILSFKMPVGFDVVVSNITQTRAENVTRI